MGAAGGAWVTGPPGTMTTRGMGGMDIDLKIKKSLEGYWQNDSIPHQLLEVVTSKVTEAIMGTWGPKFDQMVESRDVQKSRLSRVEGEMKSSAAEIQRLQAQVDTVNTR